MIGLIGALPRRQKAYIFLGIDLLLIPVAFLFTFTVQVLPQPPLQTLISILPVLPYLMAIAVGMLFWLGLPFVRLNAYERHAIGLTAVLAVVLAGSSALLMNMGSVLGIPQGMLPMGTHVVFGICFFLLSVSARVILHQLVLTVYRSVRPRRRVLIYGAGTTGTQLAQALKAHESIDPVAFVDDNTSLQGMMLMGLPVFPPSRTAEIVEARDISRVLLAMPSQSRPKQAQVARRLQKLGLEVQTLPSFAQLIGEEALVEKLTPVAPQNFLGRATHDMPLEESQSSYSGRSILISGAGGSIGSELCRQVLTCAPSRLVLFELSELALYAVLQELELLTEGTDIELIPVLGSVADDRQVRQVLREFEVQVVLHAAAYKHVPLVEANPLPGLANNVLGTQVLAQESAQVGVERFILISSDKAVRPTNVMGGSKRLAELIVQDLASRSHTTIFSMVRFGNVLGSSGSVIPLFQEQISRGGPVTVTDPDVKRYFMTISEAVQLVLKAGANANGGEVFVLDMGPLVPILQLARQVIQSAGYTVRDDETPDGDIEIKFTGLRPGEKIVEELAVSGQLFGTRHQKIFQAREKLLSEIEVASFLKALHQSIDTQDTEAAYAVVQRWVEGFKFEDTKRKSS